ncbi:MAG: superoxide dismutase [Alphaproteobacteria bacterium]|nr:superoxide dismutase [Alphaproteobacteria bacterium]
MFTLAQYPLPYATDALAPYISQETIETHYGKHVATYIDNLNKLIQDTPYETVSLTQIIQDTAGRPDQQKIFNNAAQVYNHEFFFRGMCPKCTAEIPQEIIDSFGSAENFKQQFKSAATSLFGSGYTWLVRDGETLKIINTGNADTPIAHDMTPILNLDVWEHAYYLDYKNRRADFIDSFLDNLVNWEFVAQNLAQSQQ